MDMKVVYVSACGVLSIAVVIIVIIIIIAIVILVAIIIVIVIINRCSKKTLNIRLSTQNKRNKMGRMQLLINTCTKSQTSDLMQ